MAYCKSEDGAGETATAEDRPQEVKPEIPSKVSIHIWMSNEAYEQVKKWARYAVLEELIEGDGRGNFTDYRDFCFNLISW